jgi:PAS domain S-box-containing protein
MELEAMRALIVEDDPDVVALVRALLKADPAVEWTVSEAGSVMVAEALAAHERPDVILLDLNLPDAHGLDLLTRMKGSFRGTAVVVLTADSDPRTGVDAIRAGAEDFLVKGGAPNELIPRALRYAAERARMRHQLAEREVQYRDIFEGNLGFICIHDLEGRLISVNPAGAEAIGYDAKDLQGRLLSELVHPNTRHLLPGYLSRIASIGFDTGLLSLLTRSGHPRVWEYRNTLRRPAAGGAPYVLGFAVDVTEQRLYERRLKEESLRDPLTGCWNRRWLEKSAGSPGLGPAWGCILVEVEDLRAADEGRGLRSAEEGLVGMARFLLAQVRVGDEVVRLDGNEFVLLLNHAGEEEVRQVVGRLYEVAGVSSPASFTLGFAVRSEREGLMDTIGRADQRLLAARSASSAAYARRRRDGADAEG